MKPRSVFDDMVPCTYIDESGEVKIDWLATYWANVAGRIFKAKQDGVEMNRVGKR